MKAVPMSGMPPPSNPNYFSDNPYQTPGFDPSAPRRGLVNMVRVVAILNAVQGGLELMMGLLYGGMGFFFSAIMRGEMARQDRPANAPDPETMQNIFMGVFAGLAAMLVLIAVLRIVAGIRNFYFQNRVFGIVTMCLGLVTSMTVYCAPTAIAVAVFGLIVLFNREVIEAFQMRANGAAAEDVVNAFNARPR